jgi:CheY-like chemotaxis protein
MLADEWVILVVDDEPDVLTISRLALKSFDVYGLPLRVVTARSKAEAIEVLNTTLKPPLGGTPLVAVAIIDVVMETDHAGLELCEYIREAMGNKLTQIYIRTGQPGIAPERTVIDRYDINGYFSKVEATENKLYSLVKSGVRQHYFTATALSFSALLSGLITLAGSRQQMALALAAVGSSVDGENGVAGALDDVGGRQSILIDGAHLFGPRMLEESDAVQLRDTLEQQPGLLLSADGDRFVMDDRHRAMLKIAAQPGRSELYWLATAAFEPPQDVIMLTYEFYKTLAVLWSRAQA